MCKNKDGSVFNSNIKGTFDYLEEILKNKKVQQSLTEKWLYTNCKYNHVIERLKPIIVKNKISTF